MIVQKLEQNCFLSCACVSITKTNRKYVVRLVVQLLEKAFEPTQPNLPAGRILFNQHSQY